MAPSITQKLSTPARSSPYLKLNSSITAWRRHVHASRALPPATMAQNAPNLKGMTRQENGFQTFELYRPPILSGRYKLVVPPTSVRDTILQRLARLIGMYEIPETLRGLPCPTLKPLNFALLSTPHEVEAEYNRLLNLRDLFWVQQLMIEMRLGYHLHHYIPSEHLCDVRRVVARAEEAILYIQDFVDAHGLVLDYHAMNHKRCATLPRTHPLLLIQPYIWIDVTPCAYSIGSSPGSSDYTSEE